MTEWIAFLRGVNVGGIAVTRARLIDLLNRLEMRSAATVLASGNVRFDYPGSAAEVQEILQCGLSAEFNYRAHVLLRTRSQVEQMLADYPFQPSPTHHSNLVLVEPEATDQLFAEVAALDSPAERFEAGAGVLYWQVPKGQSTTTPLAKVLGRKRYQPVTTTRTVQTVRKLLDA